MAPPARQTLMLPLAVLVAWVIAVPANAGPPGENGPIVHVVPEDGASAGDIYSTTPDGSSSRVVAAGYFTALDVSPNGATVLATELNGPSDSDGAIVAIDLATGAKEVLVESGASAAVWSGDGGAFAYTGADGGLSVDEGAGEPRPLPLMGWEATVWDWSPIDERVLVSMDAFDGFAYVRLDTINTETEEIVNLLSTTADLRFSGGDFSPDGTDLVFGYTTDSTTLIRLLNDEEGPIARSGTQGGPAGPVTWSPDGTKIAFPRTTAAGHHMVIYTVATGEKVIFRIRGVGSLDWAPLTPQPTRPFVDVPADHIFDDAISWLAERGITRGCNPPDNTRFCPDELLTRGQMAAFLVRAFGYSGGDGADRFTDDDNSIFEAAIDRLAGAGVTFGCNPPDNTRFCPNEFVSREQTAAFLVRALDLDDDGGGDLFTDDDNSIFEAAIDRLAAAGVTFGCNPPENSRFCPDHLVTRGQIAAFFYRAFN
ncbi:MAG TPA: S-layer homology domain-containing protein [Acidimicrobiia bacterium]|nr:S-layer homology domain-containing protein [Acidimicrobiia bacterium]